MTKECLPSLAPAGIELQPENHLFPHKSEISRLFQRNSAPRRMENEEKEDATERKRQQKQKMELLAEPPRRCGLPAHLSRC